MLVVGPACAPELVIGADAQILCSDGDVCPGGLVCDVAAGLCVPEGATLDRAPPFLADTSVVDGLDVIGPGRSATITLVASEPLREAPVVTRSRTIGDVVEEVPLPVDAAGDDGTTWTATLASSADDISGTASLTATLVDTSDNTNTLRVPVEIAFDLDAPVPVFARADVAAEQGSNALFPGAPRSIRGDSALVVEVLFDELLDTATLSTLDAAGDVIGAPLDGNVLPRLARFSLPFGAFTGAADGELVLAVNATDVHGNVFAGPIQALLSPALAVDNEPPPPPVVELVARRPWGSLVPAPVTAGVGTASDALVVLVLPGGVTAVEGEVPPTIARIPAGDGTFSFDIPVDVPGLSVISVDDAGNLSAPARPLVARVTASVLDSASPHHVVARPVARRALAQRGDRPVDSEVRAGFSAVTAAPFWRPLTPIVADAMPAVPVLAPDFVNDAVLAVSSGRSFLIDGAQVRELNVPPLPIRDGAAMSFDPLRGVVVLFGGNGLGTAATNGLYEWDGARWSERLQNDPLDSARPAPRVGHTVVDVPALGGVLIVNGCGARVFDGIAGCLDALPPDVWLWDGEAFTELCRGAACGAAPPPLAPAIGVDVDGRVIAVSGHSSPPTATKIGAPVVAVFSNDTWTRECGPGCSENAPRDAVAFERDGELLVYGTVDGGPALQRYDAGGFSALPLLARSGAFAANDFQVPPITMRPDGAIVIASSASFLGDQTVILIDDGTQDALAPSPFQPRCGGASVGASVGTALGVALAAGCSACDVVRSDFSLGCIGPLDSQQLIDGAAIVDVTSTGTAPRGAAVAAVIGGRLVVATQDPASSDVLLSSTAGLAWIAGSRLPANGLTLVPSALVNDPITVGRALLFLGDAEPDAAITLDRIDAVDGNGTASALCTSGCGTDALAAGGFAAAGARDAFAVFSGGWQSGIALATETAMLDGQPLRAVALPASAARPPARARAGLAFDQTRQVAWLFGGTTEVPVRFGGQVFACRPGGPPECDDVWAFDGSAWGEVRPVDVLGTGAPTARAAAQIAFDTGLVIAGGEALDASDDVWRLETSTLIAPAHIFEAQLEAMGEDAATPLTGVEVVWCGAAFDANGDQVDVKIELWTPAGFTALDVETAVLDASCRRATPPPTTALAFVPRGVESSVFVQVKPTTTSAPVPGVAAGFARLETTGFEVVVEFAP